METKDRNDEAFAFIIKAFEEAETYRNIEGYVDKFIDNKIYWIADYAPDRKMYLECKRSEISEGMSDIRLQELGGKVDVL